jgi:hypothetical protein
MRVSTDKHAVVFQEAKVYFCPRGCAKADLLRARPVCHQSLGE